MPLRYEIRVNITREDARAAHRAHRAMTSSGAIRERDARGHRRHGIDVAAETLPERVTLPDPERPGRSSICWRREGLDTETASPLAFALMILVFGAMPVLIGDRPALDGTG